MDQRNRLNPSVLESSDMSSLDTAEGGGGGGGGEARRERGGSGDRNREREHELLYLDEDEEAQLQEAIRLSMSEYERSREKHLVPSSSSYREEYLSSSSSPAPAHFPYSSSSMGEGQQQQEGSWRSIECDCRQEERRRSGGRGGGETSLSFLTSEEDALQQAIQASLQDIRGDVGAFSSHVGPNERDFSSSFSSRGKAEEREREDPVGGRRDLQGPRSSSIHPLPQSRKTEETFSYLERSPSFSFSNKSASSSACLFPQLFPSRTSASDDVSHLLLPASSSCSSSSSLSFSSERHHHRQHSHSRSSSSSSLLQGKSENDLCCAPLSWGEEEEEDIQIQLQWYYLTAYFSNRSSRSSSFLRSVKEGISRSEDSISSPSEETRECCLSCLVCRNFSFFEISLSRDSRGKPKEGDRTASITTTTTTTTSTDSSSSSSASSLTVPSSVGKRYEGQGGGGGEEKGLKKSEEAGEKRSSLPPLDFLYICDRCSYQHRGGGVHTLETSGSLEGHSTTFMPRDFLPLDLLRSSSSRSSSVGTREKYREKLLEILRPLEKDVLTSLLETVFGSRQTRAISTEGIKRWFDHPFLFGGDSVCNLVSSSSASLSFSGESKKREEEEQISSHEEGRREKERRERCLSSLHPFFACPWGLVQIHGGPCGVLASVESFLLSFLFFSPSRSRRSQVFLQDIYTFLHMTDEREKERYLLSKIGGGAAESSSSSVRVPLFSHIVSSLQKEEAGVRQAEEKKKEEEKESRDPSRCDVSSVHSREGKKRRGGEREVSSLAGEHSSEGDRKNSEEEEREEEEKKKRRNPFVVNPEFLTLRGFTSLVRRHALIEALSSILFQCTYTSHYIVAYAELHTSHRKKHTSPSFSSSPSKITSLLPKTISGDSHLKEDEERRGRDSEHDEEEEDAESVLRECIQVYVQQFDNIQKVMQFYWEYYDLLVESPSSVVSLLFSVVLTRGIQRVKQKKTKKEINIQHRLQID
ncbi:hypothetical protein CSUI_001996 [Cystoisospora suis]|uniref:Deubiquitinating enzyme MINDY-3/4 conserved domain-containing protein n=1 Tax=Cystoisospora suis TaxID=483139 RepID=A0A2C6L6F0_9APIC|nr:hypothetical protein CSUI_001996 [Cystoisospora suis]